MEVFSHIKYVIAITLSFSIAHLLRGTVKFIQHPNRAKPYITHLLWVIYMYLTLIHFWWFEYRLTAITQWYFFSYFFIILYITNYYVICTILYPDDINDYKDYKDYFFSRKTWFFGLLSVAFIADIFDTLIKGQEYFNRLGWEVPARDLSLVILCFVGIKVKSPKFHLGLVIAFILYELFFIARLYDVPIIK
jgi:hypothetical protein